VGENYGISSHDKRAGGWEKITKKEGLRGEGILLLALSSSNASAEPSG